MDYPHVFGKYVLLERLGIGGMSEVDLARQRMGEGDFVRFVVIKRVKTDHTNDASFIRMFKDEARITAELHHACIGQVYDFGRHGDEYYLALEYVPGMDVREMVSTLAAREERVPVRYALRITADVLDGLAYAHSKRDSLGKPMGIVHRDVNPRNIMVSVQGETKLIDFGVAQATNRLEHTKTDHVKGKFSYMAPEQVRGEPLDGRADLFALGLTFHELLTGANAFVGLNQVQIVHRLLHAQLPRLPEIEEMPDDRLLRAFHDQALARDPADRFANAAAMRRSLDRVAAAIGGLPTHDEMAEFVHTINPQLEARLHRKIERYSGPLELNSSGGGVVPFVLDSSLSGTIAPPGPADSSQSITIISTPAAVVLSAGALGTALLVLLIVFAIGSFALVRGWSDQPGPVPQVEPISKPVSAPVPDPTPVAVPAPVQPTPPPVEPKPVVRPTPVRPRPVRPAPAPVEPEPTEAPQPAVGTIKVAGEAKTVELRGSQGSFAGGQVPAGSYVIWATFGGDPVRAGSVKVGPGEQVGVRCVAAFKRCVVD